MQKNQSAKDNVTPEPEILRKNKAISFALDPIVIDPLILSAK